MCIVYSPPNKIRFTIIKVSALEVLSVNKLQWMRLRLRDDLLELAVVGGTWADDAALAGQ